MQPGLLPLHVEVEGEGDAEVAVVDLEDVADVDLDQDLVGPVVERDVHAGVVPGQADVGLDLGVAGDGVGHGPHRRGEQAQLQQQQLEAQLRQQGRQRAHPPPPPSPRRRRPVHDAHLCLTEGHDDNLS